MARRALFSRQIAKSEPLPAIPVIETGADFPLATLEAWAEKTHALLDAAGRRYPKHLLVGLDKVSRAWLVRSNSGHLAEIDAVAVAIRRPGAYFFSVNYEWACTCRAAPSPEGDAARLIRVLDWQTPGLGANLVCAKVRGAAALPFAVITWPGYTGVLQVMAPGRFSAALNQAPMRDPTGLFYIDWAVNRRRVWTMASPTPAHLLRRVAEEARDFSEASRMLAEAPISTPGIFTLAGTEPSETLVIERTEDEARVRGGGDAVAANHWGELLGEPGWQGQARGDRSHERSRVMRSVEPRFDEAFPWLVPPVLNAKTRLAMVADARTGRLMARGYEESGPATQVLDLLWDAAV